MSETPTPPKVRGDFCPVCERFIGPADTCPYCQEESAKSPVLKALRLASLILGVGGLLLLFYTSTHKEIPVVPIDTIKPTMNFAYIRIRGRVVRKPFVSHKKGLADYVSFLVDDGTGQLRVAAYREVAKRLEEDKRIPWSGDFVDVAGGLSVLAGGRPKLRIQVVEHFKIEKKSEFGKRKTDKTITTPRRQGYGGQTKNTEGT